MVNTRSKVAEANGRAAISPSCTRRRPFAISCRKRRSASRTISGDNSCNEALGNERECGSSAEANLQKVMMRFKFNARERRVDDCHIHAVQQTTENDRAEPSAWLTHLRCHEMLECH